MASHDGSTRCQTSAARHAGTPISVLVVIVVIVVLRPAPELITACASLALAAGVAARRAAGAFSR